MTWRSLSVVTLKEFRHMRHDRLTLLLTFGLPIFQLILYGYALDTRIRHLPAAVLNLDSHQAGRLLAERISQSPLFAVNAAYHTQTEVESALRAGAIRVAVEIPANYTSDLLYRKQTGLRVWIDGTDVVSSNYVLSALDALGFEESVAHTGLQASPLRLVPTVDIRPTVLFNPEGRTSAFLIPGLIALLVQMVTTLLIAHSITTERERGTLEQMLTTSIGADSIIAGKCLAIGCVGLFESCILVLVMRWMFGIAIEGSLALLAASLPLLVLAPLGLGLLIASKARVHAHVLQLTHIVFLPSVMLSGFFLPREFLKFPLGLFSNLLPATYLVALARNIILRGASLAEIGPTLAAAAACGIVLTALGWRTLRASLR